jgi:hypothetical protein
MDDLRGMVRAMTARERKAPITVGVFGEFLVALNERLEALEALFGVSQVGAAPPKPKVRAKAGSGR